MRHRMIVAAGGTAAALVVAAGAVVWVNRSAPRSDSAHAASLPTATVRRTNLVDHQDEDGTLGYAHSYRVLAAGRGVLTWVPSDGDVIGRGKRAYTIDDRSVPLFYGSTPLYRTLRDGVSDGHDVYELEHNLVKLGYGSGMTVDDHFTAATADAVRAWQDDHDLPETGTVSPADVVVEPGQIRVTSVRQDAGAHAHGVVYEASGTGRTVAVKVPVDKQQIARLGARVQVELPAGNTTTGRVSSVGSVAHRSGGGSQGTQNATINVHVSLDHPSAAGRLDGAPVTVSFTSAVHRGVLAVPVTALLARPGGGYSVEEVGGKGGRRTVPVSLGMFASGQVEVSGHRIAAGTRVEVPSS